MIDTTPCKSNRTEYRQAYYAKNKEKALAQVREYYEKNKTRIAMKQKQYNQIHRSRKAATNRAYKERNKEKILKQRKEYYARRRDSIVAQAKDYYQRNKARVEANYNRTKSTVNSEAMRIQYILQHDVNICYCTSTHENTMSNEKMSLAYLLSA